MMQIKIIPNDKGNPPGKLADAELHFGTGPLDGLKLIGFAIWERRGASGYNVTFPARSYAVNGERRSFALLRPISDVTAQQRIKDLITEAYREHLDVDDYRSGQAMVASHPNEPTPAPTSTKKTDDDIPF